MVYEVFIKYFYFLFARNKKSVTFALAKRGRPVFRKRDTGVKV